MELDAPLVAISDREAHLARNQLACYSILVQQRLTPGHPNPRPMHLGIRTKFIGILVIAAALPVLIALTAIETLGYRHLVRESGSKFAAGAEHVAQHLGLLTDRQCAALHDLAALDRWGEAMAASQPDPGTRARADLEADALALDRRWASLPTTAPEVAQILTNRLAGRLREFQQLHPHFAEILVTDSLGRLVASTGKTSDFWQADEPWWQESSRLSGRATWIEGLHRDESAGVFSLDLAIPLRSTTTTGQPLVGVVKAVLDASPLVSSIRPILMDDQPIREIMGADGRILLRLFVPGFVPASAALPDATLRQIVTARRGWVLAPSGNDPRRMIGFAPLAVGGILTPTVPAAGTSPLFVLVHDSEASVLSPVRRQVLGLGAAGFLLVAVFSLAGFLIASRHMIAPLELLRTAARTIATTARLESFPPPAATRFNTPDNSPSGPDPLRDVERIRTGDEIEHLASDFSIMARRVLQYHEQLEAELAAKTAELQQDLAMAREFQESLMPSVYPEIPGPATPDPLHLHFHHIYQPTMSVGGDFFDLLKLSEHRAGIFIADVMGHGARSALVTAILRTLLQDLARDADDPAKFLAALNQHFHGIVQHSRQTMFVSAFYLVLDTANAAITYASAGHPVPLRANRKTGDVEPLIRDLGRNPALGLFPQCTYTTFSGPLSDGDRFFLFTDGIIEAIDPEGREFGVDRLKETIRNNLDRDIDACSRSIVQAVRRFTGTANLEDDICLVLAEARSRRSSSPAPAANRSMLPTAR